MAISSSVKEGYRSLFSSLAKINTLTIEQWERAGEKQLDCARSYGKIAFNQLKATQKISNLSDMKGFTSESMASTGNIVKQLLEDSKELVELGSQYRHQLLAIVKTTANENAAEQAVDEPAVAETEAAPNKGKKTVTDKETTGTASGKKS